MSKKIILGIMWTFSILFILMGVSGIFHSAIITGILFLLFGALLFPPLLKQLEITGNKPTKAKRTLIGAIVLFTAIIFMPKTSDIQQPNSINSNIAETVDVGKDNSSTLEEAAESTENDSENKDNAKTETDPSQTKSEVVTKSVSDNKIDGKMTVNFIDVGQGDSILIDSDGQFMLIDAGTNEAGEDVVNYLNKKGVNELNYVIGTHPHEDHVGGLDDVINSFNIDKIIMPDVTTDTQTFVDVIDAISDKGLKITKPVVGTEYALGDAKFTILAPNSNDYSDLNNYSVVIKLTYGKTSFLLTGDAEELSEKEIIDNGIDLSADVLKLGHHGSSYSSSDEFLDAVGATSAVISVGEENQYGHPAVETLKKILDRKIKLYRTDELGTIIATSDGKKVTFNKKANTKSIKAVIDKATATPTPTAKPKPTATPTPTEKVEEPDSKEITVYVTNTGSKYHVDGCQYLRQSQIAISLDDAISEGYEPCSRCNPPR